MYIIQNQCCFLYFKILRWWYNVFSICMGVVAEKIGISATVFPQLEGCPLIWFENLITSHFLSSLKILNNMEMYKESLLMFIALFSLGANWSCKFFPLILRYERLGWSCCFLALLHHQGYDFGRHFYDSLWSGFTSTKYPVEALASWTSGILFSFSGLLVYHRTGGIDYLENVTTDWVS